MPGDSRPPLPPGNQLGALSHGGRPRKTQDVRDAEEWGKTGGRPQEVIKQLFADATGAEKSGERTTAAREFLDRIIGKPMQAVEVSGPDGDPLLPQFDLSALSDADAGALLKLLRLARKPAEKP